MRIAMSERSQKLDIRRSMNILFVYLLLFDKIGHVSAISTYQDEALWTKKLWNKFKLDFPYSVFGGVDDLIENGIHGLKVQDTISSDENVGTVLGEGEGEGEAAMNLVEDHSLLGPWPRATLDKRRKDHERKENMPKISRFSISMLDKSHSLSTAMPAVQCPACNSLVSLLWPIVTNWTNTAMKMATKSDNWDDVENLSEVDLSKYVLRPFEVQDLVDELCDVEVPVDVLKNHVFLRIKVNYDVDKDSPEVMNLDSILETMDKAFSRKKRGVSAEFGTPSKFKMITSSETFYILTQRKQQYATLSEIEVVKDACKSIIDIGNDYSDSDEISTGESDGTAGTDDTVKDVQFDIVKSIIELQKEYVLYLFTKLAHIDQKDYTKLKINTQILSEDDVENLHAETLLAPQRQCWDMHPQCQLWAQIGECKANPNYMVGTPETGRCRKSCGICSPPVSSNPLEGLIDIHEAENESLRLFKTLKTNSCAKRNFCNIYSTSSPSSEYENLKLIVESDPGSASLVEHTEYMTFSREFIALDTFEYIHKRPENFPGLDQSLLKASRLLFSYKYNSSILPRGRHGKPEIPRQLHPSEDSSLIEKRLWDLLSDTCLYVSAGYWAYEFCYQSSLLQYHFKNNKDTSPWVISLGVFTDSTLERNAAEGTSLWPPGVSVSFVRYHFENGNNCELTGETGVSPGHSKGSREKNTNSERLVGSIVGRRTEVRFMCSPDRYRHMTVDEPEQCQYLLEIYLPEICELEGFAVKLDELYGTKTWGSEFSEENEEEYTDMSRDDGTASIRDQPDKDYPQSEQNPDYTEDEKEEDEDEDEDKLHYENYTAEDNIVVEFLERDEL